MSFKRPLPASFSNDSCGGWEEAGGGGGGGEGGEGEGEGERGERGVKGFLSIPPLSSTEAAAFWTKQAHMAAVAAASTSVSKGGEGGGEGGRGGRRGESKGGRGGGGGGEGVKKKLLQGQGMDRPRNQVGRTGGREGGREGMSAESTRSTCLGDFRLSPSLPPTHSTIHL